MDDARIECDDGKTWHYVAEDKEQGLKIDFVHKSVGFPTWYGKESPGYTSAHSIAYGYFWAGHVEGTLTMDGREIHFTGKGARERTDMPDSCPAEVGGWHDWVWFHFDEIFGTLDEMKFTQIKEGSFYLVDEQKYASYRTFEIEHHDWAYLTEIGAFVPTKYRVIIDTDEGTLDFSANIVGAAVWAASGRVPDSPFALLHWDTVEGTFTYNDGRKRSLTNGRAENICRQWKPYPRLSTPEAFGILPQLTNAPIL
jgi:hypothetical protein